MNIKSIFSHGRTGPGTTTDGRRRGSRDPNGAMPSSIVKQPAKDDSELSQNVDVAAQEGAFL